MITRPTIEDVFADNHSTCHQQYFVVDAKIGMRTDEDDDEPKYITLAGTLPYQEIQIQESNRNNKYNN